MSKDITARVGGQPEHTPSVLGVFGYRLGREEVFATASSADSVTLGYRKGRRQWVNEIRTISGPDSLRLCSDVAHGRMPPSILADWIDDHHPGCEAVARVIRDGEPMWSDVT